MKSIFKLLLITLFFNYTTVSGQIWKKLEKKAEKAIEKKLEKKVEKETEKAMDSILDPNEKKAKEKTPKDFPTSNKKEEPDNRNLSDELTVYSKFDFVPGDKLIFFDDFSDDFIGDFPSKWNTNGSGEVVTLNITNGKWFEIKSGHNVFYIPDVPNLPEDYTVEFDLLATGIDHKTSSSTVLRIILTDATKFSWGKNYVYASLPLCQYHPVGMRVRSSAMDINNNVTADIRKAVMKQPHVSIAVNKQRFRLWVNEKKYIDIPRFLAKGNITNKLRFELPYMKDGKDRLFISNLKVAEGGIDLRRTLIAKGKVSTNGILFDSGKAILKTQSYGIIRQISQVLQQEQNMKLNIIGHTDADGDNQANLKLSKQRAEAVKKALINIYNISSSRLETDGKGESEPIQDNTTTNGKAQNRRVEFIKL